MPNALYDALIGPQAGSAAPFLISPDGTLVTHGDFVARAARLANALARRGLRPGDRVAVQVAKSPMALAIYAACLQAGLVFLPLNPAYTGEEVAYFLENSGALLYLGPKDGPGHAVATGLGIRSETVEGDGSGGLATLAEACPEGFETVSRRPDDIAAILYTSGTTGRSKGAALTQDNLLSNAQVLRDLWRFSDRDVLLHALPIFHTHGLFVATNVMLLAGGAMLFLPRFDTDAVLAALPQATAMMGVPTFYTRLLADPRVTREAVAHMRLFVSGSAPLSAETHAEFERRLGHRILERYGMTETSMITSNPYAGERRGGTVGLPLPGIEVRITDPATGATLPAGAIGRIEVRGPNVFAGYWRMPEKTAEEMRADGFFVTGDLGTFSDDGYLSIVGREKELIISGGYNIYPKEVEAAIERIDGVAECAVVGAPDADLGECVHAYVVPQPGYVLDTDAIRAGLTGTLARYKQPRAICIIEELPRNAMGKVQKGRLTPQAG